MKQIQLRSTHLPSSKHLKVHHPFAMRIALHPLTFKDAFLKEERAVAVAFRTAPLPGVGRAVLHLPWPTDFQYALCKRPVTPCTFFANPLKNHENI